jgi:prepilin-type N-terminal cleavage/methylation domain-containing protein
MSRRAGVSLIEMMIVVTIIALLAGLTYPSLTSGLDSLRLRSTSNSIMALLNTALDRADRRQQAVEIVISPRENSLTARSADAAFTRRLDLADSIQITKIMPPAEVPPDEPRRFLLYPGGAVPGIGIEISNKSGRKRMVAVDPITGVPRSELEK